MWTTLLISLLSWASVPYHYQAVEEICIQAGPGSQSTRGATNLDEDEGVSTEFTGMLPKMGPAIAHPRTQEGQNPWTFIRSFPKHDIISTGTQKYKK